MAALVADDGGYYVAANEAALALTGFSREELLERSVSDLTAAGDAAVERAPLEFVRQIGSPAGLVFAAAEGWLHRARALRRVCQRCSRRPRVVPDTSRAARGTRMTPLPTRTQQLGLLILLAALTIYVFVRVL